MQIFRKTLTSFALFAMLFLLAPSQSAAAEVLDAAAAPLEYEAILTEEPFAEFAAGFIQRSRLVRCSSTGYRPQYCDTRRISPGRVSLVRRHSDAPCIRGRTWGTDRRGIWVSQGCRATFRVGFDRGRRVWW